MLVIGKGYREAGQEVIIETDNIVEKWISGLLTWLCQAVVS